jgi:serine/threonine protein phosphatase PrpC
VTRLDVVAVTHHGAVRDHNEDTIAVGGFLSNAYLGEPVRIAISSERPVPCLVADGLGGHAEGARASRLAAGFLADAWARSADPDELVEAVRLADEAIYEEMRQSPAWQGMGTTLAGIVFDGDRGICVNVGDSRCYRVGDGVLAQVSRDDSPPKAPGSPPGTITTIVTQTLGGTPTQVVIDPHVYTCPAEPGDRFLLCSDGLSDYVPFDVIEQELIAAGDSGPAVWALLGAALDNGAPDNVSIVLATVLT